MSSTTIYTNTRPTTAPTHNGESITVTARHDDSVIAIDWQRSDRAEHGEIPLSVTITVEEFQAIADALNRRIED